MHGPVERPPALDAAARDRCEGYGVACDVPRVPELRVRLRDERRPVLREHVERDDAGVRGYGEPLDPLLPEQPVVGERARERPRELLQLVEACVDEPPFQRGHDDHVRGPERARDDPDEDEHDANPDSAGQRHGAIPT